MKIKIMKLREDAILPVKATPGSAAYDVAVPEDIVIHPGRQVVPLGFALGLPEGHEAKIEARSGYSTKGFAGYIRKRKECLFFFVEHGDWLPREVRLDADVISGKVDSDYRGGVGVIVNSYEDRDFLVRRGQRIAQMTIYRVNKADFIEVDELDSTERSGGFGHSGN